MKKTSLRFFYYAFLGLVFGLIDWFYLDWLAHISWGTLGNSILVIPVIIAINYGVWLIPILPIEYIESRISDKRINTIIAGILTWSCALFSYYFYYATLLSMGKLVHLEHLNIFENDLKTIWPEYWQMFNRIILSQFFEWILIAIIGGVVTGALTFWFFRKITIVKVRNTQVNSK